MAETDEYGECCCERNRGMKKIDPESQENFLKQNRRRV